MSPAIVDARCGRRPQGRRRPAAGWRALAVAGAVMVAAAAAVAAWPAVCGWAAARQAEGQVSELSARHAAMSTDEAAEAWGLAREANRALAETDAWSVPRERALDALDAGGTGAIASIEVPKLDLRVPVYRDCSDEHLMAGAGLVEGTSLPVGGAGTNAVIAGHTGLPGAWVFDEIDRLQPGDEVVVRVLGDELAYAVEYSEVVLPTEVARLAPRAGADEVTLLTCRPAGVNTHRLIVHAVRVEGAGAGGDAGDAGGSGEAADAGERLQGMADVALACVAGAMGCCALIVLLSWRNDDEEEDGSGAGRGPGEGDCDEG